MASYEPGEASWSQLQKDFKGLGDHGTTKTLGKNWNADKGMMDGKDSDIGDGNFQLGDTDQVYLDKDTWEKHRNTDKTWEMYAKVHGQEAMESKKEGNPEGLSASAFDGMIDRLYEGNEEEEPRDYGFTPEDYKYSQPIMDAKERVSKFQTDRMSGAYYDTPDEADDAAEAAGAQMKSSKKGSMGEAYELD